MNVQLRPEHFYDPLHMQIFEATRLIGRSIVNPVTLKTFFHDHADLVMMGQPAYPGDRLMG